MSKILKPFSEKGYDEIINEVGQFRYNIFDQGEAIPSQVFKKDFNFDYYNCVIAGTGSTLTMCSLDLKLPKKFTIPREASVVIVRLLRYDDSHGDPHYNADDQIIFPTEDGRIWRLARNSAPDHFISIVGSTNLFTIAEAYQLPEEKSGHISQYTEKGAKLHINLHPIKSDWNVLDGSST